jgi:hypothetical protein
MESENQQANGRTDNLNSLETEVEKITFFRNREKGAGDDMKEKSRLKIDTLSTYTLNKAE